MNYRDIISIIYGIPFVWIGIAHFTDPNWFEPIVPEILGNAYFWVILSGIFEVLIGVGIMIPRFRKISAFAMILMLITLYWANLNMWINNIPLSGETYADKWHVLRGVIQIALILTALWIGKFPPFKDEIYEKENLLIFEGEIFSSGFDSGDRIVIGNWKNSPFGEFTDIMWAKPNGEKVLIAPNEGILDFIASMYSFDNTIISEFEIEESTNHIIVKNSEIVCELKWNRGIKIPLNRPLWFISSIEYIFGLILFKTKTHGITKNKKQEWYAVKKISKLEEIKIIINGENLGKMRNFEPKAGFGFSEPVKKPSVVSVKTHIQK